MLRCFYFTNVSGAADEIKGIINLCIGGSVVVVNHNFTYPLGSAEISEKYPRRDSINSYVYYCHISVTSKSHH